MDFRRFFSDSVSMAFTKKKMLRATQNIFSNMYTQIRSINTPPSKPLSLSLSPRSFTPAMPSN